MTEAPLLDVDDLTIQYETNTETITAVSNASFTIEEGEYFGLVGESGCGKSTLMKSIIGGLDDNGRIESGTIRYRGTEIQDYSEQELNEEIRWNEISFIPQGSMDSLDPLQRIDEQAIEIARANTDIGDEEAREKFRELFEIVGLSPDRISDHPHQFSGGMQQRAIIALALFLEPSLVLADEPTTALDVIMQDQIMKYLDKIQTSTDTSMLMVTHDISLIFESCDQMAIMHGGQIAESGRTTDLYDEPHHPYSMLLQEAFPDIRFPDRNLGIIDGHPPELTEKPNFCTFVDRCPWATEECWTEEPDLKPVGEDGADHAAACFRRDEALQEFRAFQESSDGPHEVSSDD